MHNKKIGIGFVGAGWMGSTLIQRIIKSDDTELLALIVTMISSLILKLMLCSFAVRTLYMVNNQSKH